MHALTEDETAAAFRHPDPVIDQALEWVLKRQAGEIDQAVFEAWLAEGADRGQALSRVLALYECPALTVATAQTASPQALQTATPRTLHSPARRLPFLPLALAASVAAAVVVPMLGSDWLRSLGADYRTGAGEIVAVDLPDGSRMQMNSQTAVAIDFEHGRRAVRLLAARPISMSRMTRRAPSPSPAASAPCGSRGPPSTWHGTQRKTSCISTAAG